MWRCILHVRHSCLYERMLGSTWAISSSYAMTLPSLVLYVPKPIDMSSTRKWYAFHVDKALLWIYVDFSCVGLWPYCLLMIGRWVGSFLMLWCCSSLLRTFVFVHEIDFMITWLYHLLPWHGIVFPFVDVIMLSVAPCLLWCEPITPLACLHDCLGRVTISMSTVGWT